MNDWQRKVMEIMHRRNLTQAQMAELLGCSQPFVCRIRKGQAAIRMSHDMGSRIQSLYSALSELGDDQ